MAIGAIVLSTPKFAAQLTHSNDETINGASPVTAGSNSVAPRAKFNQPTTDSGAVDFAYPAAKSNRRFADQNGKIYLLKMMSSWAMAQNCSDAEITSALEGLKLLGFNAVAVAPFGVHLNNSFGDRYKNKSGQRFFTGASFSSAFGPAWSSMDWVVQEATRLQMTVVLSQFLSWGDTGTTSASNKRWVNE